MPSKVPPFDLYFEPVFLENYKKLLSKERKAVDKALTYISGNPRHASLNTHKATNVSAKYMVGGDDVFIAYATMNLRVTFEYGPEPGMIAIRNCGHHDTCERQM